MKRFARISGEKGQGLAEYILIMALIAMICYVAIQTLGKNAQTLFTKSGTKVSDAGQGW